VQFDFSYISRNLPFFAEGLAVTVELSVIAVLLSVGWGLPVALAKGSKARPVQLLANAYIEVARDTPLLVQILFIYFGFAAAGFGLSGFASALLALTLQHGAYVSEIYRSGFVSVSRQQVEGGMALGMSRWEILRIVILPQAIVRVIPPLGNQFIGIVKDTSLASAIAVVEVTHVGRILTERAAASYEILVTVALIYLFLSTVIAVLVSYAERRLAFSH
jgi:polar amino acid transport system permease protein